ncbi:alpha/beta hydrolase family protein [Ulvibacterium sp.]|uniref:alpha/beta hydrolase family protein n=1 Tax=Ulvibacterium sp. TaxID=2665914 RepID=UPI003BA881FD
MYKIVIAVLLLHPIFCKGQKSKIDDKDTLLQKIISDPSQQEIDDTLFKLKQRDLSPKNVLIHDSIVLANTNTLYVLSHIVEDNTHYGAVIVPKRKDDLKLPIIIFATGGDGIHTEFDISTDFNHRAVQFPSFLGENLDEEFMVVIPSFRGQQLSIGNKKYLSEGSVGDAFDGATTDALGFLNVVLGNFDQADKDRIGILGGSRGGTVALLASVRDKRIKRAVVIAAPSDMKALYGLYPNQFKLLFFKDLLSGNISEKEARQRFIASSPIHFAKELPLVQLHHDVNDPFVPIDFAKNLVLKMMERKNGVHLYSYEENIHGFWDDEQYWARVQDFIKKLGK